MTAVPRTAVPINMEASSLHLCSAIVSEWPGPHIARWLLHLQALCLHSGKEENRRGRKKGDEPKDFSCAGFAILF
jgi:hypothetical protein